MNPAAVAYSSVAIEGAVDRFCGRPFSQNPYSRTDAAEAFEARGWGWEEADYYLELRGQEEAQRWLAA